MKEDKGTPISPEKKSLMPRGEGRARGGGEYRKECLPIPTCYISFSETPPLNIAFSTYIPTGKCVVIPTPRSETGIFSIWDKVKQ